MEYIFAISPIDAESKEKQVSRMLEKRTEVTSRAGSSFLWKITDRLDRSNQGKSVSEVVRKRRILRMRIWSILLILLGVMLVLPGIMDPSELFIPLIFGVFVILYGISNLVITKEKSLLFDKAAKSLLQGLGEASDVRIVFAQEGLLLPEQEIIPYEKIEYVVETEDLFGIFQDGTVVILQKKDLISHRPEEFTDLIANILPKGELIQAMQE
ncbi:MAG: hypothetical protein Q4A75_09200 [Peptostreptococcaceae bacterium]|nr:hypothetical protein [Peptostreptococcaceae bacterium]